MELLKLKKKKKKKSPGPNGMHPEFIKQSGPFARQTLLKFYNLTLKIKTPNN
jgi:hypothetical protein